MVTPTSSRIVGTTPLAPSPHLRRWIVGAAVAAAALGALGVAGWIRGWANVPFLPHSANVVPFASASALVIALALLALTLRPRRPVTSGVRVVAGTLLLVTVLSAVLSVVGSPLSLEGWLLRFAQRVVPRLGAGAITPPLSAIGVALLGLSLLLLTGTSGRRLAGIPAMLAAFEGAVVCLGYLYRAPVSVREYYGHMGWPGGVAFVLLGGAVMAAAGPDAPPLRMFVGGTARAILLRRFLPVTIAALLVMDWVTTRLFAGMNPAVASATSALLVASCVAAVVVPLARTVGAELDRALLAVRESEAHFRTLFDNMQEGLAHCRMLYADGRPDDFIYLSVNAAFERLTGLAGVEGRRVSEVIPGIRESDPGLFATYGRVAAGGGPEQFEVHLQALRQWFSISVYSPQPGHFVAIFHVITARKEAEERVRLLNVDLERRVAERTAELEASNRELEAFAYSVSHDLRAPLRSINGFSRALVEDCAPTLSETGRGHVARVQAATQRMGQLIDDLLRLSRVTRSEMRRESVDLSALAAEVVADLRRRDPARRVDVRITPNLTVRGDRALLALVMENLIRNAWKFTSRGERATIEVGAGSLDGRHATFVRDDGAGFDMTYADKLFAPFQRLHSAAEFEGTGIGLAIVQRVVQRHGGAVRAEGAVGRGATFTFTLG
jgi:signal transduction histidine kinase